MGVVRILKPAAVYFGLVFGAGFALGPVRVLWLEPRVGRRAAELIEAPVMLLAVVLAGRWVGRRVCAGHGPAARLGVGLATAGLVLAADLVVGVGLRGMSAAEVFTGRDPVSGAVYYALVALCAAAPWAFGRGGRSATLGVSSAHPRSAADRFYGRWIVANAAAEGLGLGATLLLGVVVGQSLDQRPGPAAVVLGAAAAVALGVALEGVLVGAFQARVLRDRAPTLPVRDWTVATAVGAGVAWLLGMVPSAAVALLHEPGGPAAGPPAEPPAWLQLTLAGLTGAVLGPVLGLAQVRVLRRFTDRPFGWLWANAAAWAAGMPLIFAGMDAVPWGAGPVPVAAAALAVCAAAGGVVGAVHGRYLRRVLPVAGRRDGRDPDAIGGDDEPRHERA